MDQLKRFPGAVAACAVAVIAAIVAVLALTIWKPAQQISATVSPEQPVVITREGLFQLEGGEVTVTASSASGQQVTMALGTSSDVRGWVSDLSYAEITGISANRSNLLTQGHDAQVSASPTPTPSPSPSSEQPQNPEASPQPSPSTSATPSLSAAGGDMWLDEATAASSATMTLRDVPAGRSLVITSDGKTASDLTVTMTWKTPHKNVLAIASGIIALLFLLIAGALVGFALWRERQHSDMHTDENDPQAPSKALSFFEEEAAGEPELPASEDDGLVEEELLSSEDEEAFEEEENAGNEYPSEDPAVVDETEDNTQPEDEPRFGRHGIVSEDEHVDPPQRESTDTGIIDLSSIRPGAVLPSRRALRQARENGENRVVIGGQEFDTGLIPQVSKDEEGTGEETAEKRPWGQIIGGWMSSKERGKKEQ